MAWTHRDFDDLGWHDCHVWGLELLVGDSSQADWRIELALSLDFILEWPDCRLDAARPAPGSARFLVAPARLVFHEVTDLAISIDEQRAGVAQTLHDWSIDAITRSAIPEPFGHTGDPYYRWDLAFNWPRGSRVVFGARGFTQTLTGAPIAVPEQRLSPSQRVVVSR